MVKEETLTQKRERAKNIAKILDSLYPMPDVPIKHNNTWQLLVSAILSANTTDAQVNKVTPKLFAKFPDPNSLAHARQSEVERIIRPVGLYRAKAKNIISTAKKIVECFNGEVPDTLDELMTLDGVGRKVANVVLAYGFGKPGFPVDTHVTRLSQRLALSEFSEPAKIEKDLCDLFPPQKWGKLSLQLISHGRRVCKARKPLCEVCALASLCPSANYVKTLHL